MFNVSGGLSAARSAGSLRARLFLIGAICRREGERMAQAPRHTAFGTMHPAVPAEFLACTLGLTMFAPHPVLVSLSLAGALTYGAVARGVRPTLLALRWQLPLIALLACVNPLFAQRGSTLLFSPFGMMPVYAESLLYGVVMAVMFMASVLWFQAARDILPQDKVLSLFGNAAPVISLMVSMTMRLIPRFVRQGHVIADARYLAAGQGALPVRQRGAGHIAHGLDDDASHPALRATGACDRRRAGCGSELCR